MGNFDVEVDGVGKVMAAIAGDLARATRISKAIVERGAKAGVYGMKISFPRRRGVTAQRLDWSPAVWHPGGAGGGGMWEAVAGLRRAMEVGSQRDIGELLITGTGVFGPRHRRIEAGQGNFFAWPTQVKGSGGEVHRSILGMKPNIAWIHVGQITADHEIARSVRMFEAEMRTRL